MGDSETFPRWNCVDWSFEEVGEVNCVSVVVVVVVETLLDEGIKGVAIDVNEI